MTKRVCMLLSLLLAFSVLAGCSGGGSSAPEPVVSDASTESGESELDAIGEPESEAEETPMPGGDGGTLVMATEASFRPYEYYEGTQVAGVDVDIANELANELGMELVVEDMPFDSIIPAVNSGKANFGAAGMSITEDRLKDVDFSIEYATSKQVILTLSDSDIMEEADLDGRLVGVQLGTVADLALSENEAIKLEQYGKYFEASNDLLNGRIDAIVMDVLPAQELVKTDERLVIRDKELFTDKYAFCVAKGDTEMLDAINRVMQRLLDEGKIDEFTMKHSATE